MTCCWTFSGCSVTSSRTCCRAATWTPVSLSVPNPSWVAESVYVSGSRSRTENAPLASACTCLDAFVSVLVTVTCEPGIAAPLASWTTPKIAPFVDCA